MSDTRTFDVFMSYNSDDASEVMAVNRTLERHGIATWMDCEQVRPGFPWQKELQRQIPVIRSAAVFVGRNGRGPWQQVEIEAFLSEFVRRRCPVIPVLLPNVRRVPKLPPFLKLMRWVDLRGAKPGGIENLIWGITGVRPPTQDGDSPPKNAYDSVKS